MPTNTHTRSCSKISTSGDRCEYFEGSAYLLDLRCFFDGRGDNAVGVNSEGLVLIMVASCERFLDTRGDALVNAGELFPLVAPSAYEYFANRPLNEAGGEEDRVSGGSERSSSLDEIVLMTIPV